MSNQDIPSTQYAVQLVGPSELRLNKEKEVFMPKPTQMVLKIEAVGLCFSDLKLLKQFTGHARKSDVLSGVSKEVLGEIPSYVSGTKPGVPGHEAVGIIVAVGEQVKRHKVGDRVLVQADWRELKTKNSNGAFGYNFEGGLQEYTLLDERIVIDKADERRSRSLDPLVDRLYETEILLVADERDGRFALGGKGLEILPRLRLARVVDDDQPVVDAVRMLRNGIDTVLREDGLVPYRHDDVALHRYFLFTR